MCLIALHSCLPQTWSSMSDAWPARMPSPDGAIAGSLRGAAPGVLTALWNELDWRELAVAQVAMLANCPSRRLSMLTLAERTGIYCPGSSSTSSSSSRSSSSSGGASSSTSGGRDGSQRSMWRRSGQGVLASAPVLFGDAMCCYNAADPMPPRLAQKVGNSTRQ